MKDARHMGTNPALGWNEQVVTMFDLVQGTRCHGSGHVILVNLLTSGWLEVSSWCFFNEHIGLPDDKTMTAMVEIEVENLVPTLKDFSKVMATDYHQGMWRDMVKAVGTMMRTVVCPFNEMMNEVICNGMLAHMTNIRKYQVCSEPGVLLMITAMVADVKLSSQ